jgi:hypothetical protein
MRARLETCLSRALVGYFLIFRLLVKCEKIYIYIFVLWGQGRPWPDPTGQLRGGPALRARVRASENGLDPARPGPRTV